MLLKNLLPLSFSTNHKSYEIELVSNTQLQWQAKVVDLDTERARFTKVSTFDDALKAGQVLVEKLENRRHSRVNSNC